MSRNNALRILEGRSRIIASLTKRIGRAKEEEIISSNSSNSRDNNTMRMMVNMAMRALNNIETMVVTKMIMTRPT